MAEEKLVVKCTQEKKTVFWVWALAIICLLPWAIIQYNASINSNSAWLLVCARRLLDGGSMFSSCYDTNPPLSIMVHYPVVILARITGIPEYRWMFILPLALIVYFSAVIQYLIRKLDWLTPSQSTVFATAYLAALTILPGLSFGDRDHLIAIGLLPMILTQLCITNKKNIPPIIKYTTLIFSAWMILIKPNYGLLPTLVIAHRLYKTKSLKIILNADFLVLATSTLTYLAIVFLFHDDFISKILPDVLNLYIPSAEIKPIKNYSIIFGGIALFCTLGYASYTKEKNHSLFIWLIVGLGISILSFIIQLKGFRCHLIEALSFTPPLLAITSYTMLNAPFLKGLQNKTYTHLIILTLLALGCMVYATPNPEFPTHTQYKSENPLSQALNKYCDGEKNCAFFMTYYNMDIMQQIQFYSGIEFASRFPSFWFLYEIRQKLEDHKDTSTPEETKRYTELKYKYYNYVKEDFKHYTPSVLLLIEQDRDPMFENQAASEIMHEIMENYVMVDKITLDRAIFYKRTMYGFHYDVTWDVYVRKNSKYYERSLKTNNQDAQ